MTDNDWLFVQCILIFVMMGVLFFAKQKSRKDGLPRFIKKHSRRQRYIRYTPNDSGQSESSQTSVETEEKEKTSSQSEEI